MNPLKKVLSLSLGLVLLATLLVLINSGIAGAQNAHLNRGEHGREHGSVPVTVVNTPLPVQGTVNISGTPNVNANITNSAITVGNPASNPVLVRDVDNPANQPFESFVCTAGGTFLINCSPGLDTVTVPNTTNSGQAAKALVIDYVSGTCQASPGADIVDVQLVIPTGGFAHFFVPVKTVSDSTELDYAFAQETRIQASPGQTVSIGTARRVGSPNFLCIPQFTGHFLTR